MFSLAHSNYTGLLSKLFSESVAAALLRRLKPVTMVCNTDDNVSEINGNCIPERKEQNRKLIGIDGYWYDITTFIPYHPGGDVLEKFVGLDATGIFHGFHRDTVLKHRKPYRKMTNDEIDNGKIGQSFRELGLYFEAQGWMKADYRWYAVKLLVTLMLFISFVLAVTQFDNTYIHYAGGVLLAAFWQQCGFFMHDFEHNHLTGDRRIDKWLGTFFGTFCFGISGKWWREEHFIHHALTTTVDYESKFWDPQMREPIWAQSEKLWPFITSKLEYYCIRVQHITFIPLCVGVGRFGIVIDSMKQERDLRELAAFGLHWVWILSLLSYLPSVKEAVIVYLIAAVCEGILHIQLVISHYCKPFNELHEIKSSSDWYKMQVESNIDITNPWWLDWFHGGLNYHLIHHLYPRMPRNYYSRATEHLKRVCKENNLEYDHCSWSEAVWRTLKHLKVMSKHFKLDPR